MQELPVQGMQKIHLTNYKAYNFKASGGLYYKISDNTTASLTGNFGETNTVYTGTDRYNLQNVTIGQYKAEVTGKNFYVRAYTTQENAGNSYDMVVTGDYMNEAYAPTANCLGAYLYWSICAIIWCCYVWPGKILHRLT